MPKWYSRWLVADKVIKILESVSDNDGARTTIKTILAPDATVFPHYYTLFNETFETLEGEINLWNGDSKIILTVGESGTIKKNTIHRYQVGAKETIDKLTYVPGNINFERAMKIIQGSHRDGLYTQLSTPGKNNPIFLAIIADLTNSNTIADTKKELDMLYESEGSKVEQVKTEFLEKYSN